jgi:hypothetical protein
VTGEKAILHLFSRNTHLEFDYGPLIVFLGKVTHPPSDKVFDS